MKQTITSEDRILGRLKLGFLLDRYKRKVHDLRLIVAGDWSPIDGKAMRQTDEDLPGKQTQNGMQDILVETFEEGTSNELCKAVRTLVMQTSLRTPVFEFEGDIAERLASINTLYLSANLGPAPRGCNAIHHMRRALLDYAIGGLGWVWGGQGWQGGPNVQYADCLDVIWDPYASIINEGQWVAVIVNKPLHYWLRMYPASYFKDLMANKAQMDDSFLDQRVELTFYFDLDGGPQGTMGVVLSERGRPIQVLQRTDSPYFFQNDGYPQPYLPLRPIYYMMLSSSRMTVGFAELMLPHQIALREAEKSQRLHIKRGVPQFHAPKGAYSERALKALESGEIGAFVEHEKAAQPGSWMSPLEASMTQMRWIQEQRQAITSQAGADPYAAGDQVDVDYAAEVKAIQSAAGLTAGVMAADHSAHWADVGKMTLAIGSNDYRPQVHYYDRTPLPFGPQDPIGKYLIPEATLVVQEDSTMFEPKDRRLARNEKMLNLAVSMAQIAPQAARLEYENLLQDANRRNIKAYFDMPAGVMPAMPGQESGAMDSEAAPA